jgi:XTP/dITP diphosphohydrolase
MRNMIIATRNEGKVREIKGIFADLPYNILSMRDIGLDIHIEEDAPDFAGNSFKKAAEISKATGEIVLADDSGLTVEALGGRPGVYSARFAGEKASDPENNELLLKLMQDVPLEKRRAAFKCVVTLYYPDGRYVQAEGTCPGRIGFEPKGEGGFGYDPLFILDAFGKTMAELAPEQKNAVSHRGLALKKLREMLMALENE